MNSILKIKKKNDNEFVIYHSKGEYKTNNGNRIVINNLNKAKDILKSIVKEKNYKKSNFLKLLFYSNDLNNEKKKIIKKEILNFIDTDLICYRAEKGSDLELLQRKSWDPYLIFCSQKFNLNFKINYSIMPIKQEINNYKKIISIINQMKNYNLTALYFLVQVTNSLLMGLNILYKKISYEVVWKDSHLEDYYNNLKWGEDREKTQKLLLKKFFLIDIINFIEILKLKEDYERKN